MTTTVNIHEAKTHLSRLIEQVTQGQEVIIAKAGRPVVRLMPFDGPPAKRRLGGLAGKGCIDADLKATFVSDIEAMFPS